jgi:hypothetical protein
MRGFGQAGMMAAILFAPSCGREPDSAPASPMEPLRRASFRALAARDFIASCPGWTTRPQSLSQIRRFDELKQLAARKQADRPVWLGENDWRGVARYSDREPCQAGEAAYGEALAAFEGALDDLAVKIAAYRD